MRRKNTLILFSVALLAVTVAIIAVRGKASHERGAIQALRSTPSPLPVGDDIPIDDDERSDAGAPLPDFVVSVGHPVSPIDESKLAEVVANESACLETCGSPCFKDKLGRLRCGMKCLSDDSCDSESVCVPTPPKGERRCRWSECEGYHSNACGEGKKCMYGGSPSGGIFICLAAGPRAAGEDCFEDMAGRASASACKSGLFCFSGVCLPARCQTNSECPIGSRCMEQSGGLTQEKHCVAICESDSDCPNSLSCLETSPGYRNCVNPSKAKCLQEGCPAGQHCRVLLGLRAHTVARCLATCSEPGVAAACTEGNVCVANPYVKGEPASCLQSCTSGKDCVDGDACVAGEEGSYCGPAIMIDEP
jgi:hypothetical protein